MSFGIRGASLEADGDEFGDDESTVDDDQSEDTPLLGRR
jgi:hypothetical protein